MKRATTSIGRLGIPAALLLLGLGVSGALAADGDAAPSTAAASANAAASQPSEPSYEIGHFEVTFSKDVPDNPTLRHKILEAMETPFELGMTADGYVARTEEKTAGVSPTLTCMTKAPTKSKMFHRSAIDSITGQLTDELVHAGLGGLYVKASEADLTGTPSGVLHLEVRSAPAELDSRPVVLGIQAISLRYAAIPEDEAKQLPLLEELLTRKVSLSRRGTPGGGIYVAATVRDAQGKTVQRADVDPASIEDVRIADLGSLPEHRFSASAIRCISDELVAGLNEKHLIAIFVQPDSADVAATMAAAKAGKTAVLHLDIHVGVVKNVRTVEVGTHKPDPDKNGNKDVDNARSELILKNSPVHPGGGNGLVRKDELDNYTAWLNRQPSRHVDAAVTPNGDGSVGLDFLVSRSSDWTIYAQVSNTGTKQTNEWRERFGFLSTDLTGHDDALTIDYSTAGFTSSHQVSVSYDTPLYFWGMDKTRNRAYASYSVYQASDVGQNSQDFQGEGEIIGDELIQNVYQDGNFFVDGFGGVRYQHSHVDNNTLDTSGDGSFILPYGGVRFDKMDDIKTLQGDVTVLSSFTNSSQSSRDQLGRLDTDSSWVIMQGDLLYSFFLEPVFDSRAYEAGHSTLCHELVFSAKGQYAFDYRLTPDQEQVAGGLYTVRGYPESATAGDTVIIASGEYRFHLPRIFDADRRAGDLFGHSFHWVPEQSYGRPDWDLVPRAFLDVAQVSNSQSESYERDATLIGAGVGVDLQIKQNFNVRVDYGVALKGLDSAQTGGDPVDAGSSRVSVVVTVSY